MDTTVHMDTMKHGIVPFYFKQMLIFDDGISYSKMILRGRYRTDLFYMNCLWCNLKGSEQHSIRTVHQQTQVCSYHRSKAYVYTTVFMNTLNANP